MKNRGRLRITLKPIGVVRTEATEIDFKERKQEVLSEVVLNRKYANGLTRIEGYSHVFVLFWLHKVPESERKELLTHPRRREDLPKVGIFSTRQRNHPNPVGLTVVELMQHRSNVLKVKGLDAIDGTPVLDIKPYDYHDAPEGIRVPDWWLLSRKRRT
jgi:tRNA-Thr(GGU) m(6)t(6)A37 methyltransferase TsaA